SHLHRLSDGRLDPMSRSLRTRTYLMLPGQRRGLHAPGSSGQSISSTANPWVLPPPLGPHWSNGGPSPMTSPSKDPSKVAHRQIDMLMDDVLNGRSPGSTPPSSQSSLTSLNPHINPMIFQNTPSNPSTPAYSPSTVCTTLPASDGPMNPTQSSMIRPATGGAGPLEELDNDGKVVSFILPSRHYVQLTPTMIFLEVHFRRSDHRGLGPYTLQ
ncbi:hypothetical protein DFH28DRAFT_917856, partial [Melampsora americana]